LTAGTKKKKKKKKNRGKALGCRSERRRVKGYKSQPQSFSKGKRVGAIFSRVFGGGISKRRGGGQASQEFLWKGGENGFYRNNLFKGGDFDSIKEGYRKEGKL